MDWAREHGYAPWWGRGTKYGYMFPEVRDAQGGVFYPFSISSIDRIELQLATIKSYRPLGARDRRLAFLDRLNAIPGVAFQLDRVDKRPSTRLSTLSSGQLDQLLRELAEMITTIASG